MKPTMLALIILAAPITAFAEANPETRSYNGNVYVKALTGACQHGYTLYGGGGGAEGILWKGISLGGEVSYQSFTDGLGLGYYTLQPGYHFKGRGRSAKWDPFVTVGLGGAWSNGGGAGGTGNLGGGFNYWFNDKVALRFDARFQGVADEGMVVFGIGVSFR